MGLTFSLVLLAIALFLAVLNLELSKKKGGIFFNKAELVRITNLEKSGQRQFFPESGRILVLEQKLDLAWKRIEELEAGLGGK